MSDDHNRLYLVTKFVCHNCGNPLKLSYNVPKRAKTIADTITGAAKVDNYISIYPCTDCYGAATAPLKAIRKALETIQKEFPE